MTVVNKQNINIKGTKEGIIFIINDDCSFEDIINELNDSLEVSNQKMLNSPLTKVILKVGYRKLSEKQKKLLQEVFKLQANLIIHTFDSEIEKMEKKIMTQANIASGIVRSGQIYKSDGNILFIGDIHPGGTIEAEGDIYVIGSLTGIAHAGVSGDNNSVIIASLMKPIQLRIGDTISNSFDNKENQNIMAYLVNKQILLDEYQHFSILDKVIGTIN